MAHTIKWPEVKKSCEKPKIKPEIADTFNWAKEERQKLKENVLISNLRKKLIEKYTEQKCFFETAIIKVMQLWNDFDNHNEMLWLTKSNIFILFWTDGKILSYLDNNWNTLFDISSFNFDDDFANLFWKKKLNKYIRKNEKWFLEYYYDWEIFPQWSPEFNSIIANFHIYKKLIK